MRHLTLAFVIAVTTALPARSAPPPVIADIPVTGSLVQQVLGDLGEVRVLLPAGGNAHTNQLRPSDAAALQDAGLLVWIGPEMTPWLDRSAQNLSTGASLALLAVPETHLLQLDAGDHEGEEGDEHADGTVDPHAWLDPRNGKLWLSAIAEALGEADPENAAAYRQNAEAAAAQIDETVAAVAARLDPVVDQRFVVFHDAFGYFTDSFGLPRAIPLALGDASTPSAARLSAIREQLQAEQATCAFAEAGYDPALIDSLVDGTDIRLGAPLDPSGISLDPGTALYAAVLDGLGTAIADCLSAAD